jgi:hypothetical protein
MAVLAYRQAWLSGRFGTPRVYRLVISARSSTLSDGSRAETAAKISLRTA